MASTHHDTFPRASYRLRSPAITAEQLVLYARASGDFNPIHLDEGFARAAGLDGLVAHGMLTMAFAASCVTGLAGPNMRIAALSSRFVSPVFAGETVEVEGKLGEPDVDGGYVVSLAGKVQDRVVLTGQARIVPLETATANRGT